MTEFVCSPSSPTFPRLKTSEPEELINKLTLVLSKLLLPNFKCSDDTVLQKLFDCISQQYVIEETEDSQQKSKLLNVFTPWFQSLISQWLFIIDAVKVFALRVMGLFSRKTEGFKVLFRSRTISCIKDLTKEQMKLANLSIALAYVEFLQAATHNDIGLQWIIATDAWRDVVNLAHSCPSIYLLKNSWKLLASIIVKMENIQVDVSHIILSSSLDPLHDTHKFIAAGDMVNPEVFQNAYPTDRTEKTTVVNSAKLAKEIILMALEQNLTPIRINNLFKNCRLEEWAWTEIHNSKDKKMITIASQLLCACNALMIFCTKDHEVPHSVAQNFIYSMTNHFHLLVTRHLFEDVVNSCIEYQYLWDRFGGKVIDENGDLSTCTAIEDHEAEVYGTENLVYRVQNFLFMVQAVPLFVFAKMCSKILESNSFKLLETFIEKLMRFSCPRLIRLCYFYRDQLHHSEPDEVEKLSRHLVYKFITLSSICKKEQAILIFQALSHSLKVLVKDPNPEEQDKISTEIKKYGHMDRYPELLSALLNGILCYLSKFNISWRDSLETVCMMILIQYVISNPNISPLICSEALKLAKLVLLKFMPVNLALLVDTLQGSSIKDLGKQLYKTLHNPNWEVRDSTLEVLQTISCLAEAKFPAFQSLLLEQGLPDVIYAAMNCDSEPYVRATAMACIGEMVKIQNIWDSVLQKKDLLGKLLLVLHYESEGIVRKQAALLVRDIYVHRNISPHLLEQTYSTLYLVAHNDLHWEVKINALEFWDSVIERSFSEEGMVDGSFPQMIFSKEKKKIIQLTSTETCYLVLKVLRKLGNLGCLCVLWGTIFDECDLEVQKKSAKLINKLKEVVTKYSVVDELQKYNMSNREELELFNNLGKCNGIVDTPETLYMELSENGNFHSDSVEDCLNTELHSVDQVIDQIIEQEDIQLIPGLIRTVKEEQVIPKINRFIIPAEEFIEKILSVDVDKILYDKLSWNQQTSEGIHSLMDDMLQFLNENKLSVNEVDCY